jgi:hypothetical protein
MRAPRGERARGSRRGRRSPSATSAPRRPVASSATPGSDSEPRRGAPLKPAVTRGSQPPAPALATTEGTSGEHPEGTERAEAAREAGVDPRATRERRTDNQADDTSREGRAPCPPTRAEAKALVTRPRAGLPREMDPVCAGELAPPGGVGFSRSCFAWEAALATGLRPAAAVRRKREPDGEDVTCSEQELRCPYMTCAAIHQ